MAKGVNVVNWKILALDLDGTIMAEGERISPAVVQSLRAAEERGVRVVLATGRADVPALHYAARLGLTTPVICYQGGMIRDPQAGHVLYERSMPPDLAIEAIRWGRAHDRHLLLFADDQLWIEELRYPREMYGRWMGLPMREVPMLDELVRSGEARRIFKLMDFATGPEAGSPDLVAEWRAAFGERLQVLRSHPMLVEATEPGMTKGRALAWLAETWQVPRAQVIAVGDTENDVSMIEWAGLGVAMGQAEEHVRAAADWVAPSVTEDGVAAVVARFILNGASLDPGTVL